MSGHLDDDQRRDLARADREDIVQALAEFRRLGAAELDRQKAKRIAGVPSIFDAPAKPADAPARDAAPAFGRRLNPID
ncbi:MULTISPECIES: hypothetical protein [unclassified Aureimonas]|uniref:hypothetical protein n=1 Tax=unclassified Aureimonas TaxID=2615206 RepID=UPI0007816792|nr:MULTISPECIES: hypothetical protein [unclassified Aureimonas]